MEEFQTLLATRQDRIDPQLLDLLLSMSDFEAFKGLMLDHKTMMLSTIKKKKVKAKPAKDNIFSSEL
jgi:hypothetical protein